ncbi:MAG: hypothetical protein HYX32_12920, partial [Actinobacteria bacterium]|nr:hypothetical protein [Actinomycetota bacterium]
MSEQYRQPGGEPERGDRSGPGASAGHRSAHHTRAYEQRLAAQPAGGMIDREGEGGKNATTAPAAPPEHGDHPKLSLAVMIFWGSVVAVPASSALVTAVLSRRVAPGELSVI